MTQFQHFTSLPPEQEAQFLIYEQRAAEATKSGITLGTIIGIAVGVLLFGIYLTVEPDHHNPMAEPEPKAQTQTAPKPAPAATPTPAPATTPEAAPTTPEAAPATTPPADPAVAAPGAAAPTTP